MDKVELVGETFLLLEKFCKRLNYSVSIDFMYGLVHVVDLGTGEERFSVTTEEDWLDALLLLIGKLKASSEVHRTS